MQVSSTAPSAGSHEPLRSDLEQKDSVTVQAVHPILHTKG